MLAILLFAHHVCAQNSAKPSTNAKQDKEIKFEGSKIEGEREKPRDLYILPWQGTSPVEGESLRLDILGGVDQYRDRFDLQRDTTYFDRTGERVY